MVRVYRMLAAALLLCLGIGNADARMYYLPDYQDRMVSRSQNKRQSSAKPTCDSFGLYAAPQGDLECTSTSPAPGLLCYSCSGCGAEYIYSNNDCPSSDYDRSDICGGKYKSCTCKTSLYPSASSESGCPAGYVVKTSSSCTDKPSGTVHYACEKDPCPGMLTSEVCVAQGGHCISSNDAMCADRCKECLDSCEYALQYQDAIDNCDLGCAPGKEISGCPGVCVADGCKTLTCSEGYTISGSECIANACAGFNLTTIPANATYESCKSGTDNKYKITSCNSGYALNAAGTLCEKKTLTCREALSAAGYAPVSSQAEYMDAAKQSKEIVLMNDLNLIDEMEVYDPVNKEYYYESFPLEIKNNIYTLASLHDDFPDCPNTLATLELDTSMNGEEIRISGSNSRPIVIHPIIAAYSPVEVYTDAHFMGGTPAITSYVLWIDTITLHNGATITFDGGKNYYVGYGIRGDAGDNITISGGSTLQSDSWHTLDRINLNKGSCIKEKGAEACALTNTVITRPQQATGESPLRVPLDCWENGWLLTNSVACRGTISVTPKCPTNSHLIMYKDMPVGYQYHDLKNSGFCLKGMTKDTSLLKCNTGYTQIDLSEIDFSMEGISLGANINYHPGGSLKDNGCYGCFNQTSFKADKIACNQSMQSDYNKALQSCKDSGEYGVSCDEYWIIDGMCELGGFPDASIFGCCNMGQYYYGEYFQDIYDLNSQYVCGEFSCDGLREVKPTIDQICTKVCDGKCVSAARGGATTTCATGYTYYGDDDAGREELSMAADACDNYADDGYQTSGMVSEAGNQNCQRCVSCSSGFYLASSTYSDKCLDTNVTITREKDNPECIRCTRDDETDPGLDQCDLFQYFHCDGQLDPYLGTCEGGSFEWLERCD